MSFDDPKLAWPRSYGARRRLGDAVSKNSAVQRMSALGVGGGTRWRQSRWGSQNSSAGLDLTRNHDQNHKESQ